MMGLVRFASPWPADLAPYWMVLLLSGAIATLGLALNSAAVVIGAMLIAPLLSPIIGLAMALAVGDGRLAVQMLIVITLSTAGVVAVAALLTVLLPFHTITPEILSRTRPTTLDLAIAVFSGLAGAVVTVAPAFLLTTLVTNNYFSRVIPSSVFFSYNFQFHKFSYYIKLYQKCRHEF